MKHKESKNIFIYLPLLAVITLIPRISSLLTPASIGGEEEEEKKEGDDDEEEDEEKIK